MGVCAGVADSIPDPDSPTLPSKRSERTSVGSRLRWSWKLLLAVVAITACAVALQQVGWSGLYEALLGLDTGLALILMAILPVLGASVILVYLVAGAKFGLAGGLLAITLVTSVHLIVTHVLGRKLLRARLEEFLQRHRHRLPQVASGQDVSLAVILALVPGLPYFVRNYALALSNVPFRVYFPVCVPIYVLRSAVTLSFGCVGGAGCASRYTLRCEDRDLYVAGSANQETHRSVRYRTWDAGKDVGRTPYL